MPGCPLTWTGRRKPRWPLGTALALLAVSGPTTAASGQERPAYPKAEEQISALREAEDRMLKRECGEKLGEAERLGLQGWPEHVRHLEDPPERRQEVAQAFLDLAGCFNRIGEFEGARHRARAAVDLAQNPAQRIVAQNELGLSILGHCRRDCSVDEPREAVNRANRERLEEGEAAFRKVLELTGGRGNAARVSLGEVLALQGRHAEAEAVFAEYLEREPEGEHAARARRAMECAALAPVKWRSRDPTVQSQGDLRPPSKIFGPNPQYTAEARRARVEGTVIVEATIDTTGALRCVRVLEGLPLGLSESAVETLLTWRYEPATLDGEPVAITANILTRFRIQ